MKHLILLVILIPQFIFSHDTVAGSDSLYFFTSNILFVPSESSIYETRTGITKYIDKKNLKLDIGVSFDLLGYKTGDNIFSLGVDFFTFSNLRNEDNFKFPVDAIDYLFGMNFNFKKPSLGINPLSSRLRISHISSHFEDGHIYEITDTIFTPAVFSKEFLNLAVMKEYDFNKNFNLKTLLAVDYIFHSIPKNISRVSGQLGLETRYYFNEILSIYFSNDITLASVNSVSNLNENFEAGFSIGKKSHRSVNLYFDYYDGQDYRGQYYGKYLNYQGLGMRIKL